MPLFSLHNSDCLAHLRTLEDCSIDSIVTDPPYGISFMGKKWDYDVPSVDIWRECLRVLKPGGHLLAFAGTRTQHRMCVNIEDAGFEIRDMIAWVYGSGFPKSHNIGKAIDKAAGAKREMVGIKKHPTLTNTTKAEKGANAAHGDNLWARQWDITAPATPEAQEWEGWGTALKPALEPITVARKPFKGTVAANVLEHGTGAINIDGCRVEMGDEYDPSNVQRQQNSNGAIKGAFGAASLIGKEIATYKPGGRWPANLIHDGSDEVVELFPEANSARIGNPNNPHRGVNHTATSYGQGDGKETHDYRDSGSAARFFYCPKVSKRERNDGLSGSCVKIDFAQSNGKGQWDQEENLALLQVDMEQSLPRVTGVFGALNKSAIEWNTLLSGSDIMESFQRDTMFTTKTETSSTTELKILSYFLSLITKGAIADARLETANGGSPVVTVENGTAQAIITKELTGSRHGAASAALKTRLRISVAANRNDHPTLKPIALMAYLCRLVTPPGGIVLDPFMGSGSTGIAALQEGFGFIGIERESEYVKIAESRVKKMLEES